MAVARTQPPALAPLRALLLILPVAGGVVALVIAASWIIRMEEVPIGAGVACVALGALAMTQTGRLQVAGRIVGFAAVAFGLVATLISGVSGMVREPAGVARVAGADAIATAVETSRAAFDHAEAVVIVDRGDTASFGAASTEAARLDAPVLLTTDLFVPRDVVVELHRLGARRARVVGIVAAQVVPRLRALGVSPTVIPPTDSAAVRVPAAHETGPFWMASTRSPADLLVASAAAAHDGSLLRIDARDGTTLRRLTRARQTGRRMIAVGGTGALPAWVLRLASG
jgi:hypothetical protein